MSNVPTRNRVEAEANCVPPLGSNRIHGRRKEWVYTEIPDVDSEFYKGGRQLLFVNWETGESYLMTMASMFVMEKNAACVRARFLRFGDSEFCEPPTVLTELFDDVITSFLAQLRLWGVWDPHVLFRLSDSRSRASNEIAG